eukprot:2951808-Prymnesium_polylepis.1
MCAAGARYAPAACPPRLVCCGAASSVHVPHLRTAASWSDSTSMACGSIGGTPGPGREPWREGERCALTTVHVHHRVRTLYTKTRKPVALAALATAVFDAAPRRARDSDRFQ